jgi:hypothetical protein
MSDQAAPTVDAIRAKAKADANKGLEQLVTLIHVLTQGNTALKEVNDKAKAIASHTKECVATLAKKHKKQSKSSSENLTKPCAVLPSFSVYVKAMRDAKLLGKIEKGSPVAAALDSIIDENVSSLLVSTLLISCDNYHQPKEEGVTFRVTSLMAQHLEEVLASVEEERQALHDEDVAAGVTDPRGVFSRDNYSSAMNNVIASHIRVKGGPVPDNEALSPNLSALQAHLKALNASLRSKRG